MFGSWNITKEKFPKPTDVLLEEIFRKLQFLKNKRAVTVVLNSNFMGGEYKLYFRLPKLFALQKWFFLKNCKR